MVRRKPQNYPSLDPYIKGYMYDRMNTGDPPKYGYPENHLPETEPGEIEIESSFAIAMRRAKAK